jgi:hypothetical protein
MAAGHGILHSGVKRYGGQSRDHLSPRDFSLTTGILVVRIRHSTADRRADDGCPDDFGL